MTTLSKNFTLAELTVSQAASRNGIDNIPGPAQIAALRLLCEKVLQPIRDHYGKPVVVSSGYRSPKVNRAVGGSPTSQHVAGEAADITVPGVSNYALCDWIHRNLNYDQLIYEFGEAGWCHVSYSAKRLRNAELSAVKRAGKTVYLTGIVR